MSLIYANSNFTICIHLLSPVHKRKGKLEVHILCSETKFSREGIKRWNDIRLFIEQSLGRYSTWTDMWWVQLAINKCSVVNHTAWCTNWHIVSQEDFRKMPSQTVPQEDLQCNQKLHLHLRNSRLLCTWDSIEVRLQYQLTITRYIIWK